MAPVPPFNLSEGPAYPYVQVADHLQARILAGELTARLPGEQSLRQEYGVALGTIRKAVGLLRSRDLVVTRPSKGTFVRRELPSRENDA